MNETAPISIIAIQMNGDIHIYLCAPTVSSDIEKSSTYHKNEYQLHASPRSFCEFRCPPAQHTEVYTRYGHTPKWSSVPKRKMLCYSHAGPLIPCTQEELPED